MPAVSDATESEFDQAVVERSHSVPVVVDFWAPWCGPCRTLGPILEDLASQSGDRWELVKVNVDESPGLSARFGIQGIPAVKAFSGGEEVAQFVGAQPKSGVESWLQTFLQDRQDRLGKMALLSRSEEVDEDELHARIRANPIDLDAVRTLAELKLVRADPDFYEPLISLIASPDQEISKQAQTALVDLIEVLPSDDHRIAPARRRLASALFP